MKPIRHSAAVVSLIVVALTGSAIDLLVPHAAGAAILPAARPVAERGTPADELITGRAEELGAGERTRSANAPRPAVSTEDLRETRAAPAAAMAEPVAEWSAPAPSLVPVVPVTVDVWGAEERYFPIGGRTPDDIVASAKANVPSDPSGAARHSIAYAGPIQWEHQPTYVIDQSTASCTMTGVTSVVRYQATVPRWTSPGPVPAELLAWWTAMMEHIRQHESEHVRIFADFVSQLPARVAGQPCSSWEAIVNAWSADIATVQATFDEAEAGWNAPPYSGPLDW